MEKWRETTRGVRKAGNSLLTFTGMEAGLLICWLTSNLHLRGGFIPLFVKSSILYMKNTDTATFILIQKLLAHK